jgi:hypothetical protein
MTPQEVFDKVATHLLTQRSRAVRPGSRYSCLYRAPDGKRCAIGCLITDDIYRPDMEGSVATTLLLRGEVQRAWPWAYRNEKALNMLDRLQVLHDREEISAWPKLLKYLAEQFGLSSAVADAALENGWVPIAQETEKT